MILNLIKKLLYLGQNKIQNFQILLFLGLLAIYYMMIKRFDYTQNGAKIKAREKGWQFKIL